MLVKDIMSRNVITVTLNDTANDVKKIFDNIKIHHVVVIEEKKLLGIISDRDILRCISPYLDTPAETPRDHFTLNKRVQQIMTSDLITVQESSPLKEAARLMLENEISCLPVLNEENMMTGILSWKDILRNVYEE
ncbi:MAG: CBS domain-containing protein [Gammaproteobacteria bacterium]